MLGTWLLRHGVLTGSNGRAQLASRTQAVEAVDALVAKIVTLEQLDAAAYTKEAEEFALSVLDPPERAGEQYAKPADWLSSVFAVSPGSLDHAGANDD